MLKEQMRSSAAVALLTRIAMAAKSQRSLCFMLMGGGRKRANEVNLGPMACLDNSFLVAAEVGDGVSAWRRIRQTRAISGAARHEADQRFS